jgi:hypothetical protein
MRTCNHCYLGLDLRRLFLTPCDALDFISIFLSFVFAGALLVSLIDIFHRWSRERWRSTRALTLSLVTIIAAWNLVPLVRHALFVWALPSYESVVRDVEAGRLQAADNFGPISYAVSRSKLTWQVWREKTPSGALMVEFDTECGFPVLHSGYLFSSSGKIEPGSRMASRWPYRKQLNKDGWFAVSD